MAQASGHIGHAGCPAAGAAAPDGEMPHRLEGHKCCISRYVLPQRCPELDGRPCVPSHVRRVATPVRGCESRTPLLGAVDKGTTWGRDVSEGSTACARPVSIHFVAAVRLNQGRDPEVTACNRPFGNKGTLGWAWYLGPCDGTGHPEPRAVSTIAREGMGTQRPLDRLWPLGVVDRS